MDDPNNPYAAGASPPLAQEADSPTLTQQSDSSTIPAGQGARFANFIVDYIAQAFLGFAFGVVLVIVGGQEAAAFLERTPGIVFGIPILLLYYFVLEVTTGRTLGKFVTGTRVVDESGGKPSVGQILGRTFCRLIPFEAFSFFGTPCRGWHDKIPKTFVVKVR